MSYGRTGWISAIARRVGIIAAALFLLIPGRIAAQEGQLGQVQDRIIAVVGDSVILETQLAERVLALQLRGFAVPENPTEELEFRMGLLQNMIDESLVLQEALSDSTLTVEDERIEQIVDADLEQRARAMGGEAALEQALTGQGMTLTAFREELAADARRRQLQEQYISKARRTVRVDPVNVDSIQAFYEANKDQIGKRPATISFLQAVLEPGPSDSAESSALADAMELYDQIIAGEDFAELAEQHSDDPGSASNGGELGWFRRNGQMVREFEDQTFMLRSGQVSLPFKTQFGYHIVKLERIRGPERRARHILIRFEVGPDQVAKTRALADSIRERTQAGESLVTLHEEYGAEGVPDSLAIPLSELNSLPAGYAPALRTAVVGEVLGPIELSGRDLPSFAVIRILEIRDEGDYTLEDLEDQIRSQIQSQMILQAVLAGLRTRRYVDIRLAQNSTN